jgi:CxxC-x17-CxxC domain-containing protein
MLGLSSRFAETVCFFPFIVMCPDPPRYEKVIEHHMSDQTLTCRDCGQEFTFTAGEQAFYAEKDYTPPQRCASCRATRKAQKESGSSYSSGGGYSSGGYSGGSSDRGGYSNAPREMHAATCSECGKQTEVPFAPTSGKPVYCRECFQNRKASNSSYGRY